MATYLRQEDLATKEASRRPLSQLGGIQTAGIWHGAVARFEMPVSEIAKKGTGGCAVLLQAVGKDGAPGPILGAATIPRADSL